MSFTNKLHITHLQNYPNRPTIIFLHDSLGCIQLWRNFPEKLGEMTQCNVLVYDRQGYGKAAPFTDPERDNIYLEKEADVLNDLLEATGIENVILFGHSDGGSIALIAAAKYPEKVAGIITEGAHIFVEEVTLIGIREAIKCYQTTDLKTKLEKYHGDKTEAMFWAWAKTWTTEEFRDWNIENFLPHIKCPALIIQGEKDEYGTLDQVEGIVTRTTGKATKFIIPNIGHTPHKETPELVLEKSAEFINAVLSGL
jgi:pimeloyl-ACP methyl ester carboxylesterase